MSMGTDTSAPATPETVQVPSDTRIAVDQFLNDPQLLKEISGLGSRFASFQDAQNKLSPNTRAMLGRVIQQGGRGQQGPPPIDEVTRAGLTNDMLQFITPEMARGVLEGVGIPSGRMRF